MRGVSFTSSSAARPAQVSLCVGVQRAQASIHRGRSAQWIVSAWARGGNVPDAIVRLVASPSTVTPEFSFGCGSHDGTSSCDLGAVDASSSQRQLQARVAVAATASSVKSVRLTAEVSAAHLPKDPAASATVTVTAAPAGGTGGTAGTGTGSGGTSTSPLSVGDLPFVQSPSSALSPGGNAGSLFPALSPSADPATSKAGQDKTSNRNVANTSALPLGAPVVGAQLIGLGALALAFVLAVTRLSIRRRPATAAAAATGTATAQSQSAQPPPTPAKPAEPAEPASEDKPEDDGGDILES
jgi:hypothetical protein